MGPEPCPGDCGLAGVEKGPGLPDDSKGVPGQDPGLD